jgi:hypothetical protein
MKTIFLSLLLLGSFVSAQAGSTINAVSRYGYGANLGWIDWRGDTNNGAVIGEYVCSGYIYSANVGWINLGNGAPTNGIYYQNVSSNDFGVNQDGSGNLRGYAWGANIGWISFESNGVPKVDMANGRMNGYAWSANCGWISLSNAFVQVKTDTIAPGADTDGDGLPDAWERLNFGNLSAVPGGDPDGDGASNLQEYLAGTNPNDPNDVLRITYVARGDVLPDFTTLRWTAKPTRFYTIQYRPTVNPGDSWLDSIGYGFGVSNSTFNTSGPTNAEFYRIRAYRPIGP